LSWMFLIQPRALRPGARSGQQRSARAGAAKLLRAARHRHRAL
jgi:hypothetical protein